MRNCVSAATVSVTVGALVLVGCGGAKKLAAVKSLSKTAVVEISAGKTVDWCSLDKENQQSTGAGIQSSVKMIKALSKGKSLSEAATEAMHPANTALASAYPLILKNISESGAFPLLDPAIVLEHEAYQAAPADTRRGEVITPEGYKAVNFRDPEGMAKLSEGLGAEGLLQVRIEFIKCLYTGAGASGQAKALADVMLVVKDRNGNTLWWDSEKEYSDRSTGMISGAYDTEKMNELCVEAADAASKRLLEKLKKKLDEMEM